MVKELHMTMIRSIGGHKCVITIDSKYNRTIKWEHKLFDEPILKGQVGYLNACASRVVEYTPDCRVVKDKQRNFVPTEEEKAYARKLKERVKK